MTMIEPGTTVAGAADDTGVPTPAPATAPVATKGWSSYSSNKKLAIGAGGGVIVGVGIWLWRRHKASQAVGAAQPAPSSASATGAGNTAPMYVLPSSNQDAVQGANDAALETALGSIGTTLNTIGNDVNNPPPPNVTVNNTGTDPKTGQPYGSLADAVALGGGPYLAALAAEKNNIPPSGQECSCPMVPAGVPTVPGPGPCNCPQPVSGSGSTGVQQTSPYIPGPTIPNGTPAVFISGLPPRVKAEA